jgi:predicted phage gp36 major capsid-like protein
MKMTKYEQANQAHNLQDVMQQLTGIMDLHADLYDYPRTTEIDFDDTLNVLRWFETTVVDIFESPEELKCRICHSAK